MKSDILWKKSYSVGIDRIDMEHKIFLELIKNFQEETFEDDDEERVVSLILEIEKYAEFHFLSEENFMKKIGYPKLEQHKNLHFNLLEKLNIVKHSKIATADFLVFAVDWFVHHTTNEDRLIAKFCEDNKIDFNFTFQIADE